MLWEYVSELRMKKSTTGDEYLLLHIFMQLVILLLSYTVFYRCIHFLDVATMSLLIVYIYIHIYVHVCVSVRV